MTSRLSDLLTAHTWPDVPTSSAGTQWQEEPVPLDVFIQDARYLKNPPLSEIQYDAVRHAERVYYPHTYAQLASSADRDIRDYWRQPVRMVNFVTLEWGKGGGKDHICRIISLRVAYLLLCLVSPQSYYEMPDQDTIHLLNVASNAPQANTAFFTPMRRAVSRKGCWLSDWADPLQGVIRYSKNIEAISGHSDAEAQEGMNLLLGVADEIDAFKREEELARLRPGQARESSKSAEAVLKMIRSSARTRFPQVFKSVRISYPRYKGSMIQVLVAEGRKDNEEHGAASTHYVSGPHPTWVVNPRVPGKEAFADDYRDEPVLARARYECDPSAAINPFFTNEQAIESCLVMTGAAGTDYRERQPVDVEYVPEPRTVILTDGSTVPVTTWAARYSFAPELFPVTGAQYAMHADFAVTKDRAGLAMAHVVRWEESEAHGTGPGGEEVLLTERRPVIKVDFVMSYSADSSAQPPREIQIRWAGDLCFELRRRGFNVRRFTTDQYQSVETRQRMERAGIETDRVSTDLSSEPWFSLRDLFNEARISMPWRKRVLDEIQGLSKMPNGKLDHLAGGSKDEADALACAVIGAVELGGEEDPDGTPAYPAVATFQQGASLPLPVGFARPRAVDPDGFTPHEVITGAVDIDQVREYMYGADPGEWVETPDPIEREQLDTFIRMPGRPD
jgi:hypothetical protein